MGLTFPLRELWNRCDPENLLTSEREILRLKIHHKGISIFLCSFPWTTGLDCDISTTFLNGRWRHYSKNRGSEIEQAGIALAGIMFLGATYSSPDIEYVPITYQHTYMNSDHKINGHDWLLFHCVLSSKCYGVPLQDNFLSNYLASASS